MNATAELTHEALNAMKLHQLLELALADLRKHEEARGCVVYMDDWLHEKDGYCCACLAGSVLRHSLGYEDFGSELEAEPWMRAIEDLRNGCVAPALFEVDQKPTKKKRDVALGLRRSMADYSFSKPEPFYEAMEKLLADLKKADL